MPARRSALLTVVGDSGAHADHQRRGDLAFGAADTHRGCGPRCCCGRFRPPPKTAPRNAGSPCAATSSGRPRKKPLRADAVEIAFEGEVIGCPAATGPTAASVARARDDAARRDPFGQASCAPRPGRDRAHSAAAAAPSRCTSMRQPDRARWPAARSLDPSGQPCRDLAAEHLRAGAPGFAIGRERAENRRAERCRQLALRPAGREQRQSRALPGTAPAPSWRSPVPAARRKIDDAPSRQQNREPAGRRCRDRISDDSDDGCGTVKPAEGLGRANAAGEKRSLDRAAGSTAVAAGCRRRSGRHRRKRQTSRARPHPCATARPRAVCSRSCPPLAPRTAYAT